MGVIADTINRVWRDYTVSGVQASGRHEPDKADIRQIGGLIETALGNVGLGTMLDVVKATKEALDGDLAHDAGAVALVYADGTDANNDLYVKTGASGSGPWTNTGALHGIVDGLTSELVAASEAATALATAYADALSQNEFSVGEEHPSAGTDLAAFSYASADPIAAAKSYTGVVIFGGSVGGTLRVSAYNDLGVAVDTQTVAVAAGEVQTRFFAALLDKPAGGYVGFEAETGGVVTWTAAPAEAWGGGVRPIPAYPGNVDLGGVIYEQIALQLHLLEKVQTVTAEAFAEQVERIDDLSSMTETAVLVIGRSGTPVASATETGGGTLMLPQRIPANGVIESIEIFGGATGGTFKLKNFISDGDDPWLIQAGDTFTQVGPDVSVEVAAGELLTLDGQSFRAYGGCFLAVYAPADSLAYTATTDDNPGWYYAGGGDQSGFTYDGGGIATTVRLEIRATVRHKALRHELLREVQAPAATGGDRWVVRYTVNGVFVGGIGAQRVDDQDPQALFFRIVSPSHGSWFDFTGYQYGGRFGGGGPLGNLIEGQLASDTEPHRPPILSWRHRDGDGGGAYPNRGAVIMARDAADLSGIWLSYQRADDPHLTIEKNDGVSKVTPGQIRIVHPEATGKIEFWVGRVIEVADGTVISAGTRVGYVSDGNVMLAGVEFSAAELAALKSLVA